MIRDPAISPRVGDTWTRGKAQLQVTQIDQAGVITLTPSGPEIASAPTRWTAAGWRESVCSWPGWAYGGEI